MPMPSKAFQMLIACCVERLFRSWLSLALIDFRRMFVISPVKVAERSSSFVVKASLMMRSLVNIIMFISSSASGIVMGVASLSSGLIECWGGGRGGSALGWHHFWSVRSPPNAPKSKSCDS